MKDKDRFEVVMQFGQGEERFSLIYDKETNGKFALDNSFIEQVDVFVHPYTGESIAFDDFSAF